MHVFGRKIIDKRTGMKFDSWKEAALKYKKAMENYERSFEAMCELHDRICYYHSCHHCAHKGKCQYEPMPGENVRTNCICFAEGEIE